MIKHFDTPTQVKFWDLDTEKYLGGIGFEDRIICLGCGGVIELDDFYDNDFPKDIEPIVLLPWVSLSDECIES